MPVTATIVADSYMTTFVTRIHVTAQSCCSTLLDIPNNLLLSGGQIVFGSIGNSAQAQDL